MRNMTGQLLEKTGDKLMLIAEKEMIAFERKERELRKQERLKRAKEKFPELQSYAGRPRFSKIYAAGLEMCHPGGACLSPGR